MCQTKSDRVSPIRSLPKGGSAPFSAPSPKEKLRVPKQTDILSKGYLQIKKSEQPNKKSTPKKKKIAEKMMNLGS